MALNNLLSMWVILAAIFIIALGVMIFLILTEKILKKKVVIKQHREDNSPRRRIKLLISTNEAPQNKLRKINAIAKEIFRNYYGIDTKLSYYEMSEKFQKEGKQLPAKFCREMFTILYSGEELQSKKMDELASLLEKIDLKAQEEKSIKNLEKDMRSSIKNTPENISLIKEFEKAEGKFIDRFAREKRQKQEPQKTIQEQPVETYATPQHIEEKPLEYKTKTDKLKNLPLIKLFRFRNNAQPQLNYTQETSAKPNELWSSIKLNAPVLEKKKEDKIEKKEKEISTFQQIEDLQKEISEREKQIDSLRTRQEITKLERTEVEVQINKNKTWPPVTFTPKHLDEIRKMPAEIENSFHKMNREIELLEEEINSKKHKIRKLQSPPAQKIQKHVEEKPSPIIKKFLNKLTNETRDIDKEVSAKQKQINLINIKEEPIPDYTGSRLITPKKQKVIVKPKNKSIKNKDFIHSVDNMDRIRSRINERRANL